MAPSRGRTILLGALALLGRFWALLVLSALVALVAFVFAPRGMTEAMLVCAIVGAAAAVAAISAGRGVLCLASGPGLIAFGATDSGCLAPRAGGACPRLRRR